MIIAVDFDGTCVTHEYPRVGKDIGAARVLRELVGNGHKIILYTMRSHRTDGGNTDTLQDAIDWFDENGIELFGINENPEQKYWTDSPKPYANLYIDDAAVGCPLTFGEELSFSERPFVNWKKIESWLKDLKIINPELPWGEEKIVEK